jgi:hypothetical protein
MDVARCDARFKAHTCKRMFTISTNWLFPTEPLGSGGVPYCIPVPSKLKAVGNEKRAFSSPA